MIKNRYLPAHSARSGIAYRQGRAIRKPLFVDSGFFKGWREANPKESHHSCQPKRQARPVQAHPASQIR